MMISKVRSIRSSLAISQHQIFQSINPLVLPTGFFMTTHNIRLRRPWHKTLVGSDVVTRVDVPESPGEAADQASTYQYARRFNCPTGLDSQSKVHLAISGWNGQIVSILLNGHPLEPGTQSMNVDVTDLLEPHNQIIIQLTGTHKAPASLTGEVGLAITKA